MQEKRGQVFTLCHARRAIQLQRDDVVGRTVAALVVNGDRRTKQDLRDEIDDLQQENQDLQDQLDAIADILSGPEEEDEDDDDDGD